jgi:hypothetical protein
MYAAYAMDTAVVRDAGRVHIERTTKLPAHPALISKGGLRCCISYSAQNQRYTAMIKLPTKRFSKFKQIVRRPYG